MQDFNAIGEQLKQMAANLEKTVKDANIHSILDAAKPKKTYPFKVGNREGKLIQTNGGMLMFELPDATENEIKTIVKRLVSNIE